MTDVPTPVQPEVDETIRETLDRFVDESVRLRMGTEPPRVDSSTGELLALLLAVRRSLDRMEELLARALRLRGYVSRRHAALRVQVEDAWDAFAVRQRQGAIRDEYSSAKERQAAANLEVLDLRRLERTAGTDAHRADEVVDQLRLRLRGLQEVRQDILAIVKIHQFESSLDR